MSKGKKIALGAGAAGVLAIVLLVAWPKKPLPVDVLAVERGVMEERVSSAASGDVEPGARAVLRAETVARILVVKAKAGDRVKAGDELLRFDDRALAAAAAAARVQHETAERDAKTAASLNKQGIITEQALLQANAARELARANYSLAEANLARARVTAPFAGVVARLPVQEGDSAVVGQALAEVVADEKLYVRAAFDEVDAVRIDPGFEAIVRLDAYPDEPLTAKVDRVDPVVGGDSIAGGAAGLDTIPLAGKKDRTVGIRVAIDRSVIPSGTTVLVGMSADVEIVLNRREGVLRVPSAAIFHEKGQEFAYVLRGGVLKRQTVETGASNWEFQEVTSGLAEKDLVLVSLDMEGIRNGVRAKPKPRPSASATPVTAAP